MKRFLIIGINSDRPDLIQLLPENQEFKYLFLNYKNRQLNTENLRSGDEFIYWEDFKSAQKLLSEIKPDKTIFITAESYLEVFLLMLCRQKSILTYHLEHGVKTYKTLELRNKLDSSQAQLSPEVTFSYKLWHKLFIIRTWLGLSEKKIAYQYYKTRSQKSSFDTHLLIKSPLRRPEEYITFSTKIFECQKKLDHLNNDTKIHYVGFPNIGKYLDIIAPSSLRKRIILIDQPFHEQGVFGWTKEEKKNVLSSIVSIAIKNNLDFYIKPHPVNDRKIYHEIEGIKIIEGDLLDRLPEFNIYIGFFSTLLIPLACLKNVVIFSLNSVTSSNEEVYSDLVDEGVVQKLSDVKDLNNHLENLESLLKSQNDIRDKFIEDWVYRFDRHYSTRMTELLSTGIINNSY